MQLSVRPEPKVDFVETAGLAADGFGKLPGSFDAARMEWLYGRAFSHGTTVLSLYAGEKKVGQVALIHQRIRLAESTERAVALVDLFILKDFRSRDAIASLYGEVERFCRASGIRFIIGVPNPSGARVNIRYLKLAPFLKLDIQAGLGDPLSLRRDLVSADMAAMARQDLAALFGRFLPLAGTGLDWTADGLCGRFAGGASRYGVHATETLLLVSSPRTTRHVPHVLLCAFMAKEGVSVPAADVRAVTAAACRLHRRPVFVYAGRNRAIELPGWPLPERLRPSPMVAQIRDFAEPAAAVDFDRFELIDFDFA